MECSKEWLVDFNVGKTYHLVSSFKMLGLTFSSKLNWGSYIICIAKTDFNKIGATNMNM